MYEKDMLEQVEVLATIKGGRAMNIQKFTQQTVEAINDCEKLAYDYGNQELEQEHLLVAL